MKKYIWGIVSLIVVVAAVGIWFLTQSGNGIKSVAQLKKITYAQTFQQKDEAYMVYFWQTDCSNCQSIERDVLKLANSVDYPVYIVDMAAKENKEAWYDWEAHHKKYDKVIGKTSKDGDMYYLGESAEKYTNDMKVHWQIAVNPKTQEIIATHNTSYENKNPQKPKDIKISGTPTMIKIQNGKTVKYATGIEEVLNLMGMESHQR